jgi:type I restriction enzyme, S subunit
VSTETVTGNSGQAKGLAGPLKFWLQRNDSGTWGEDPTGLNDTIVLRSTEIRLDGSWNIANPAIRHLTNEHRMAKKLLSGDLVVVTSSGSLRHLGKTAIVTDEVAALSPCFANFVQRLRPSQKTVAKFVWYVMQSKRTASELEVLGTTSTGLRNLNGSIIESITFPGFAPSEQRQIADFLDRETNRIDAIIDARLRMIELLEEKRDVSIRDFVVGSGDREGPPWALSIGDDRKLLRLGSVLEMRREKNNPIVTNQILSLTAARGVIRYEDKGDIGNKASEDISRYSVVHKGDIVVNSMNVIIGSVGLSKYEGALSPVYYVLRPVNETVIDRRFLAYHFKIREFQRQLIRLGYGILDHRMRIPWLNLKSELLVLPSLPEQQQIADFLDRETNRIDAIIGKCRESVALLRERRQALITAAVTGELEVAA